eukprot:g11053.t1
MPTLVPSLSFSRSSLGAGDSTVLNSFRKLEAETCALIKFHLHYFAEDKEDKIKEMSSKLLKQIQDAESAAAAAPPPTAVSTSGEQQTAATSSSSSSGASLADEDLSSGDKSGGSTSPATSRSCTSASPKQVVCSNTPGYFESRAAEQDVGRSQATAVPRINLSSGGACRDEAGDGAKKTPSSSRENTPRSVAAAIGGFFQSIVGGAGASSTVSGSATETEASAGEEGNSSSSTAPSKSASKSASVVSTRCHPLIVHTTEAELLSLLKGCALSVTDQDEAIALLERGLRRNPVSQMSWTCLGELYYERLELEKALHCFRNSIDFTGESPPVCRNLSIVLRCLSNQQGAMPGRLSGGEALRYAELAVELDPTDSLNWEGLGNYYLDYFGKRNTALALKKASDAYNEAAAIDAESPFGRSPTLYVNRGVVSLFRLNVTESYEHFTTCAKVFSPYAEQARVKIREILSLVKALDEHVSSKAGQNIRPNKLQAVSKSLKEARKKLTAAASSSTPTITSSAGGAAKPKPGTSTSGTSTSASPVVYGGWRVCVNETLLPHRTQAVPAPRSTSLSPAPRLLVKVVHKIEIEVPILLVCIDEELQFLVVALTGTDAAQLMKKVRLLESTMEVTDFALQDLMYKNGRSWNCVSVTEPRFLYLDGVNLGNLAVACEGE